VAPTWPNFNDFFQDFILFWTTQRSQCLISTVLPKPRQKNNRTVDSKKLFGWIQLLDTLDSSLEFTETDIELVLPVDNSSDPYVGHN